MNKLANNSNFKGLERNLKLEKEKISKVLSLKSLRLLNENEWWGNYFPDYAWSKRVLSKKKFTRSKNGINFYKKI